MSADTSSRTPWGLIFSIALNGLLVGLLVGVLLSRGPVPGGGPPGPGGPPGVDRGFGMGMLRAAPEDDRREIRRALSQSWRDTEVERDRIHEAQRRIAEAVSAPSFDKAAVLQGFEQWREADMRVKAQVQQAMVEVLDTLAPETRQKIAEDMRRHDMRRMRRVNRRERFHERRDGRD